MGRHDPKAERLVAATDDEIDDAIAAKRAPNLSQDQVQLLLLLRYQGGLNPTELETHFRDQYRR